MQHVICIKWSADNKYILSGSDEMNIRLWKANAAEKLGAVSPALFSISFLFSLQLQWISYLRSLAAYWLLLGKQEVVLSVPIKSCIFLSCQMYCTLYFAMFYLMLFYELAAFFDTAMAQGPPQQGKSG